MADILFVMKYPLNGQETLIPKFQGQMAADGAAGPPSVVSGLG